MTQLPFRSATELAAAIRGKEISSTELVECYLDRIQALNPGLGAVVTVAAERARSEAGEADRRLARGEEVGPLHGLPVTVKDCLETAGMRTTCGAAELAGYVPDHDAEAVGRLRRAGAIIAGKTNLPAWASDCPVLQRAIRDHQQPTGYLANPGRLIRRCGGRGGGRAVRPGAGQRPGRIAADPRGVVRGICTEALLRHHPGARPHPSAAGTLAEMDIGVLGPLARSAADPSLCLTVLARLDPAEAAGWRLELPASPARDLRAWRVAVWPDEPGWPLDRAIAERLKTAADALAAAGMRLEERRPVNLDESLDVAQRLIQGQVAGFLPEPDFAALTARAARLDPRTSPRPPGLPATSPSRRGSWPRPSSSSAHCAPPGPGSSATTTFCCARPCAPRPYLITTPPT